jgi:hypothetical protein
MEIMAELTLAGLLVLLVGEIMTGIHGSNSSL